MLGIVELFEKILVFLDCKTLLLAQDVSAKWAQVIKGNTKLQKKLYLVPATFEEAIDLNMVNDDALVMFPNNRFTLPPGTHEKTNCSTQPSVDGLC